MKKVLGYVTENKPDRVEDFKAGAKEIMGWAKANFDDIEFYTPRDYDTENILIFAKYEGEELAPRFYIMVDGLK